jgi:putative ABC transport system permease protein
MEKFINSIPKWAERFLRTICPDDMYEEIEGDLIQQFNKNLNTIGHRKSSIKLFITVIRFFRPGILFRKKLAITHNWFDLFKNDLQLTFRQFRRNPLFAFLNIIGLSTSMAVVLMIAQYAGFHFGFDRHHENSSKIFRVYSRNYEGSKLSFESALTNYKIGPLLKNEFPEVSSYTQLMPTDSWFDCTLRFDGKDGAVIYSERKLYFTDNRFFQQFPARAIAGNLNNALVNPFSVVLTKSAANRYFNDVNPLGKILHLKGSFEQNEYQVTAVIEDLPTNTHLDIDILMSLSSLEKNQGVGNNDFYTYISLQDNVDVGLFGKKILSFSKHFISAGQQRVEHYIQPLTNIHLHSDLQDEIKEGTDLNAIYFLIVIGIVILVIAWINYVNLSMSQIFEKARQVGIRKVNGASSARIAGQFFTEAVVINLLGIAMAIILIELTTPMIERLTDTRFTWNTFSDFSWYNPVIYVVLLIATGILISAIYPSTVLASLNPVSILKGKILTIDRRGFAGNALITFQFVCSIVLLSIVFVVHHQYTFMQNKKPGVDIGRTLIVKAPVETDSTYGNKFAAFKNYAATNLFVESISTSTSVPGQNIEWTGRVSSPGMQLAQNLHIQVADTAYLRNYQIPLLMGRDFIFTDYPLEKFGIKTEPVILNMKAVEVLGFASEADALGRTIFWDDNECTVVGIVANYHQQSLKSEFTPTLFTANAGPLMSIKLSENFEKDFHHSIVRLEEVWRKFFPESAFDFFYLPDYYLSHYKSERNIRTIIDIISSLALITSCLGLLGLSAFAAKQKIKEVCIRKVMGAQFIEILLLLSKKFLFLICLAALIAVPLALMQCTHWLHGYAFHVELQIWHFVLPVAIVMLISSITILSQCWKVGINNAIDLLRTE